MKKAKIVTLGATMLSLLFALIFKLSGADHFFTSIGVGGIFLSIYIAISATESMKMSQKAIAIFQYLAAAVCMILCILTIIKQF